VRWSCGLLRWLRSRRAGIQPVLKYLGRGRLVDDGTPGPPANAARSQRTRSCNRGQPLVDQLDGYRRNHRGQALRVMPGHRGGATLPSGQGYREPDDDAHGLVFAHELRECPHIVLTIGIAPKRCQRRRQDPALIAAGHPDPDGPDVDAEPHACRCHERLPRRRAAPPIREPTGAQPPTMSRCRLTACRAPRCATAPRRTPPATSPHRRRPPARDRPYRRRGRPELARTP
jgi:hypothetical protein